MAAVTAWSLRPHQLFSGIILLTPIVLAFLFGSIALSEPDNEGKTIWSRYRGLTRLIVIIAVAAWCAISELQGIMQFQSSVFWTPPIVSLGLFLIVCYAFDRKLMNLRWSSSQIVWRAWWKLVSIVIPLLMLPIGYQGFMDRRLGSGAACFIAAGIVAKIGTGFSRWADGMKFNILKTGEIRNRAFTLAREMGITLGRVFVVPAGKGRLTNAFGTGNSIGLTDNLGKYLTRDQIKFVIAHELAHVKLKHGRMYLILILGVYSSLAPILFLAAPVTQQARTIIIAAIILLPTILSSWFSRRMEYAADRTAIQFTQDPENAIRALARLHNSKELPAPRDSFGELFASHPSFDQRVFAIAQNGELSGNRLSAILTDERVEHPPGRSVEEHIAN
jgi:Zn-dependent protease with chaperone function